VLIETPGRACADNNDWSRVLTDQSHITAGCELALEAP
jgi:hypothetical protein